MESTIFILIVDNDIQVRNRLGQLLKRRGYEIAGVNTDEEALSFLKSNNVDLIIIDLALPGKCGFDLLPTVKETFPEIAIIAATPYGDAHSVKKALKMGADEYLTKPFRDQEITLVVERVCWRFLSHQSRPSPIPIP
ncbi:MAG: response regulator [candidate division Zixibacteria bacterium]|nr:response regulator [candidate division Zixibacteria bacterium]